MRSVVFRQAARYAAAPAGAAAAATTTSSLISEKGSASASKRVVAHCSNRLLRKCKRAFADASSATNRSVSAAAIEAEVAAAAPAAPATASSKAAMASGSNGGGVGGGGGFVAWYEKHLEKTPVKTKMITGAFLWGIGDAVAQVVPFIMYGDKQEGKKTEGVAIAVTPPPRRTFVYDYARTARAVFFGFAIHAPSAHVHYNFLEWMTVRAGFTGLKIPIFKAFMEQFVYWSWFSNSLYHGAMGAMQGQGPKEIYDRIADVLWETQKAQWVFWIPIQLLNFRFVPVRHQLNVVLVTSIIWTALLSAWYPPLEEGEEDKDKVKDDEKEMIKNDVSIVKVTN